MAWQTVQSSILGANRFRSDTNQMASRKRTVRAPGTTNVAIFPILICLFQVTDTVCGYGTSTRESLFIFITFLRCIAVWVRWSGCTVPYQCDYKSGVIVFGSSLRNSFAVFLDVPRFQQHVQCSFLGDAVEFNAVEIDANVFIIGIVIIYLGDGLCSIYSYVCCFSLYYVYFLQRPTPLPFTSFHKCFHWYVSVCACLL